MEFAIAGFREVVTPTMTMRLFGWMLANPKHNLKRSKREDEPKLRTPKSKGTLKKSRVF
jgi:hypothetical protein